MNSSVDTGTFVNPGDEFIETMDEVIDIHVDNETPYVIGGANLSNDWERTVQQLYPKSEGYNGHN